MSITKRSVVIVGAGIAGLACARRLHALGNNALVLEAADRAGGRIKTDRQGGYLLDRGFQVLQTAYPEAQRSLDLSRLQLRCFAPGAMIRIGRRFYTLADPLRRPRHLLGTLSAPIGSIGDRLRLLRLVRRVTRQPLETFFHGSESTAMQFLQAEGFSNTMINRFFVPFFGGVCLEPHIRASSRVICYVLRMFATGEAALPADGMEQIPRQLAEALPAGCIQTGMRVRQVHADGVTLADGSSMSANAVVVATEAPEAARLLGAASSPASVSETCLYFSCDRAPWHSSFLMLNGDGDGPINNLTFPSQVSSAYAPAGQSLASVVVLGNPGETDIELEQDVRDQLGAWFGADVNRWQHLKTVRIQHALPDQSPPTSDPNRLSLQGPPGRFVCGEYGSLPGIQWALRSGRQAADAVQAYLQTR